MKKDKTLENIEVHLEMMLTEEIKSHAVISEEHHSIDTQVFRLLSGYDEALVNIKKLESLLKDSLRHQYDAFIKADYMKMPDNNIQDIQHYFDSKKLSEET
ncbi:MAG: hypothetical protein PF569_02230 [Candidatus Woesearchaeota archaeon]|jgi:hypothetical protein|nr:hypothetical protein [Candidatus Woesearchaeota archaeon]